jgi:hypothetical protein
MSWSLVRSPKEQHVISARLESASLWWLSWMRSYSCSCLAFFIGGPPWGAAPLPSQLRESRCQWCP